MVADDLDASLGDRGRREVPEYNATLPAQDPLGGAHWANSMGDPRVLSNFLNWLVWCCFQCLKVGGAYIWKVPTFSNSFVLSEGNKEHKKRP